MTYKTTGYFGNKFRTLDLPVFSQGHKYIHRTKIIDGAHLIMS